MKSQQYDVMVVGSGVVGSAIARELSRYELKVGVLEKELDVVCETSGRNSGVLHAGFNNKPGTLMAKFCVQGCLGFDKVAKELNIPFKRTGKLVVGFSDEDIESLKELKAKGDKNGVPGLEIVSHEKIKELAPNVEGRAALYSPMTGILDPFIYTIALAENACENGVDFYLGREVINIEKDEKFYRITTKNNEIYYSRWIINSAGLNSDKVANMLGVEDYIIHPCRGEYFILDQRAGQFLNIPAYPVPNKKEGGLGIHLTPSIHGNIFIGPSAQYIDEKDDYSATEDVMNMLVKEGTKILPQIKREHFIRNFSGIRPKLVGKDKGGYADFVIEERNEIPNVINLIGIESPGLTSAVPIAEYVVDKMKAKENLKENKSFNPIRKGIVRVIDQCEEKQAELINKNPDYGEIICRCENVTKAEIVQAINNPLGVDTLTGIKYRTRCMMGRCQGGYCQTKIAELVMKEKNKDIDEVNYLRQNGRMFSGEVRQWK